MGGRNVQSLMIMISSPRTKSTSCAAVQVKSTGSLVTVSLVPSQCSDTQVYTHKTNASGGWPNALDAFNFSQLLASATATAITTTTWLQAYSQLLSVLHSSFHFEIFWRHIGYGPYTHSNDVVVRTCWHQCIDIATIADGWTASLGILSIIRQLFFGNEGEIGEMLHCYTQIILLCLLCEKKQTNNEYSKKDNAWCMYCNYKI